MSYFEYSHVVPVNKDGFYQERACVNVKKTGLAGVVTRHGHF